MACRASPKSKGTGIIYAGMHSATETYANWLRYMGMNAIAYHGGLEPEERRRIEAGVTWPIAIRN